MARTESIVPGGLAAGWILASLALESAPMARAEAVAGLPPDASATPLDPDLLNAAELRTLPGIGPARALQIVRARWDSALRGGPESWEQLPGIGPATVGSIRAGLTDGRVEGSAEAAYTGPLPP